MTIRIILTGVLLGACISAQAAALSPPAAAVEGPIAQPIAVAHPWLEHVGGSAAAPAAAAEATVDQRLLAPVSADELQRMRTQSRSHMQGWPSSANSELSLALPFDSSPPDFAQSFPSLPLEAPEPNAQGSILTNFTGILATGWFPPDTVIAVGPTQVLTATNVGYAIYAKTGRPIRAYTSFDSFFAGLRPANWAAHGGFMFDPKVYYDWYHQKFVMFALGRDDVSETSHFFVAISRSDDASATWWSWRFDWPETTTWVDYSSISADQWGLYITGNVLFFGGGFRYVQLWTLNPAMFSGGASNGWRFWDLRWPLAGDPLAFDLHAARPQSIAGGSESFFVNSSEGSYNQMGLWKLTGDRTNAPTLTRAAIPTGTYYPVYINVRQPDTSARIDGFGSQVVEAVYSNRRVWATLTSGENAAAPSWGGMYTARLDVDSNTMDWNHLIWSPDQYYTFPAVTVAPGSVTAASPNVGIFGSWTAPDRYGSTIFYLNDPDGSNTFAYYKSGNARYVELDAGGRNRWGDYSGAAYDWSCGTLWGAAEFANTINRWGTQIAEVDFTGTGACARIDVTQPSASSIWYAGNSATVQWTQSSLTAGNSIYVRLYNNGSYLTQLAGPLSGSSTSVTVTLPWAATSLAQIFVGSWNPTSSSWQTTDLSDAYFTLAAAPDLWPSSFSSPVSSVSSGGSLQLNTTVSNAGNANSPTTTLRFYRSSNNIISNLDTLLGTSTIFALSPGNGTSRQLTTSNTGTAGIWYFGACIDFVSNEPTANNCTSSPVAITVTSDALFANGFE